jgi:transposase
MVSYWSKKFYNREYEEQKSFYDTLRQIIESPESFPSNRLNNNKIKKYLKKQVLNDETGEIIDSDKLKALIDIDKVNEDLSLLGWYSIITSETYMDEREIIDTSHNLVEIEDQFRVMKSTLDTRPIFVRTDEHIIAHLTMCTISLILLRLIQRKITLKFQKTLSADRIQSALNKWKVEKLADDYYRFNDIDDSDLKLILDSFEIELPKKLYKPIDLRTLKSNINLS